MTAHIVTAVEDRVARIELARPEKKNALTAEMYAALARALAAAESDGAVRAVLIHGAPGCFCAGNDLGDFLARPAGGETPAVEFLTRISKATKPIVAAVAGPAVGIGTTMLLHCDLVYAAPSARFQLPFVSLGLVPEAASSLLLPMTAGYQRAAELLLLGEPFGVEKAFAAGFVTEVVGEAAVTDRARAAARSLAALPPESVRLTKKLMKGPLAPGIAAQMEEELRLFSQRLASPEAKEALSAFLEKRRPDFSRFS
jgi:enoyl-CoA hydratase/carnithine racemase